MEFYLKYLKKKSSVFKKHFLDSDNYWDKNNEYHKIKIDIIMIWIVQKKLWLINN